MIDKAPKKENAGSPSTPLTLNTKPLRDIMLTLTARHADYVKNMITGAAQMDGANSLFRS